MGVDERGMKRMWSAECGMKRMRNADGYTQTTGYRAILVFPGIGARFLPTTTGIFFRHDPWWLSNYTSSVNWNTRFIVWVMHRVRMLKHGLRSNTPSSFNWSTQFIVRIS